MLYLISRGDTALLKRNKQSLQSKNKTDGHLTMALLGARWSNSPPKQNDQAASGDQGGS